MADLITLLPQVSWNQNAMPPAPDAALNSGVLVPLGGNLFAGAPAKGPGYYGSKPQWSNVIKQITNDNDGDEAGEYVMQAQQTVQFFVGDNMSGLSQFIGKVHLQGTLVSNPNEPNIWYDIPETLVDFTVQSPVSYTPVIPFAGNYVWVRAVIDWSSLLANGVVLKILYAKA